MASNSSSVAVSAAIGWRCHTCGEPAASGVVHIDLRKVRAAETALAAWRGRPREGVSRALDLADIFAAPTVEQWQVVCAGCCHNCVGCYAIDLGQVRSLHALIAWTAHLYDKSWFTATNWIAFIHRVAQEHADPREPMGVW